MANSFGFCRVAKWFEELKTSFQSASQKYQPLFKNKAIYRIVIYIKRFVRLVSFFDALAQRRDSSRGACSKKKKLFLMFFCSGCNPEGMDGVDAGFLEACLQESMQARHQRRSLNQNKFFSLLS